MALRGILEGNKGRVLETVNPGTGIKGRSFLMSDSRDVNEAAQRAGRAFFFWRSLARKERARYFQALKHVIVEWGDAIAATISEENGKVAVECWEEILVALQMLQFYKQHGFSDVTTFRGTGPLAFCKKVRTTIPPSSRGQLVGVVGIIPPWNYPFMIPMNIAIRSMSYGNTILLKPSEQTPLSGMLIKLIANEAWKRSGFAKSCRESPIQVVQGNQEVGQMMVRMLNDGTLDFLVFCGSSEVGRKIKRAVSDPSQLELLLGGKDAFVVLEDCDIEMTVEALVGSSLFNTGQSCSSTERVYVAEQIAGVVTAKTLEKIQKLKVGYDPNDPTLDMGPIMNEKQFNTVVSHLEDAKAKGAKIIFGGKRLRGGVYEGGHYLEPTIVVEVNHGMDLMTEETFGPVISIMTATNEEELVRLANDSRFGLTASVWTKDLARGERIAERLEAGSVYVNDVFWTASEPKVHWPGAKESGNDIDEKTPRGDKVIAITRGNLIDRLSQFWLRKNTARKLAFIKALVKFGYRF